MCQILFSTEKNPPVQALVDANDMNKDGFGFAWVEGQNVKWRKGFKEKELTKDLIETYMNLPFPKAIHFRLATHGGVVPALTHPFPIKRGIPHDLTGLAKGVLFHNGIWHSYDDRLREGILAGTINPNVMLGGMSDSRAMAVLAQRFGDDFLDLLNLGGNRVLVLRNDTWYTYGQWTEKEGWRASNSHIFRGNDSVVVRDKKGRWQGKELAVVSPTYVSEGRVSEGSGRSDDRKRAVDTPTGGVVDSHNSLLFEASYDQVKERLQAWENMGRRVN